MDSLITAAAHALARGDPIGALKLVALRNDAPGLALRGTAMAQLGELARARTLLRSAARAFGVREAVARARCVVAEAEVALAARDISWAAKRLEAARVTLIQHGDTANAAHAHYLSIRHLLLVGRLDEAERALADDSTTLPPALRITHALIVAHIAARRVRAGAARAALLGARSLARRAGIPALAAEVEAAREALRLPAARQLGSDGERLLRLDEVEAVLASGALVIDGCRHAVRCNEVVVQLAARPVLLTLVQALALAWPADVPRAALITKAFRLKRAEESPRARLRVEMGRLRRLLRGLAEIHATAGGFALRPLDARPVRILARPVDEPHADVLALLADGESWSSSALALALGTSQRTVQRVLDALAAAGKAQPLGRGRARRWMSAPAPGFTTLLLLPAALPTN